MHKLMGCQCQNWNLQGKRTPCVRSTMVLLEMKQLLLLLQQGKTDFETCPEELQREKVWIQKGMAKQGKGFDSCEYTSLGTWLSQKNSLAQTTVLFQSPLFLWLFLWKRIVFRIISLRVLNMCEQVVSQHLQLSGAGCQRFALGELSPARSGSFGHCSSSHPEDIRSGMKKRGWKQQE